MQALIERFPQDLLDALSISASQPLQKNYPKFANVLICGMGGSGIGGRLVADWFKHELDIPVNFCQDYVLPKYVNSKTLVIASSYSGETEETLSAVEQAHTKGAYIIALTTGGKLAHFCKRFNYECFVISGGKPPRTQLGFSLVLITHVFSQLKLIPTDALDSYKSASNLLTERQEDINCIARELADFIHESSLVIYCDSQNEGIAIRARQQFNENSKILCSHHCIPEMNHNELVGWCGKNSNQRVLFLQTENENQQITKRFAFLSDFLREIDIPTYTLSFESLDKIHSAMFLIHAVDWASNYLADLNDVDAIEVNIINELKSKL